MPRRPKTTQADDFAEVVNQIANSRSEVDLAPPHPEQNQTTAAEILDPHYTYTCKIKRFLIGDINTDDEYAQLTTDAINGKIMIMTERFVDTKEGDTYVVLKYLTMTPKLIPALRDPTQF
jgi:hypothetical protein